MKNIFFHVEQLTLRKWYMHLFSQILADFVSRPDGHSIDFPQYQPLIKSFTQSFDDLFKLNN